MVGGSNGEVRLMNLQQLQPINNHFIGVDLLQPQISVDVLPVGQHEGLLKYVGLQYLFVHRKVMI